MCFFCIVFFFFFLPADRRSHINDHIMGGMQAFYTVFGADDDELLSYYFDYREDDDDDLDAQAIDAGDEVRERKTPSPAPRPLLCTLEYADPAYDSPLL